MAEQAFIKRAPKNTPRQLTALAGEVLAEVAPELAPAAGDDEAVIAAQQRRARTKRHLRWGDDGDGSMWLRGSLPHLHAAPLLAVEEAYAESDRRAERDRFKSTRATNPSPRIVREQVVDDNHRSPDQRRADALTPPLIFLMVVFGVRYQSKDRQRRSRHPPVSYLTGRYSISGSGPVASPRRVFSASMPARLLRYRPQHLDNVGTVQRWESFHLDGRHCGALFRDITPERLLTRVAFPLDEDEAYLVESVIVRDGSSWQALTFWQQLGDVHVTAQRGAHEGLSMPGYGEFLLLETMIADGIEQLDFEAIIDSAPEGPSATAWMQWMGTDEVPSLDGRSLQGHRIDVRIADAVTSSHWVVNHQIVASDWNGAQSFLRESADDALEGIAYGLVAFLREGPSALPAQAVEASDPE